MKVLESASLFILSGGAEEGGSGARVPYMSIQNFNLRVLFTENDLYLIVIQH